MRRYDIVTGILFILSIIEFALAAPVLVQEKRQARTDVDHVVHIPKDVITVHVLGKRWEPDKLEFAGERLWNSLVTERPGLGALPSRPNHAPPPPPPPNPASSTANQVLLLEWRPEWRPGSSISPNVAQPPPLATPNPALSTANPNQVTWLDRVRGADAGSYKGNDELPASGPPHTVTPTSSGYTSPDDEFAEAHLHPPPKKPNSGSWSSTDSESSEPSTPTPRPASPKEFGQAHADQVGNVDPPSADTPSPTGYNSHPETVVHSPSPGAGSPTEPESEVIPQLPPSPYSGLNSLSADSQPVDLRTAILAAIYAARGGAKESRQISGIARDVGNAT